LYDYVVHHRHSYDEPGQIHLVTILLVHPDPVAGDDAARMQPRRDPRDAIAELAVGPRPARSLERSPDEVGMVRAQAGLRIEQAADVLPGERLEPGRRQATHGRPAPSAPLEDRLALLHESVRRLLVVLRHRAAHMPEGLGIERIDERAMERVVHVALDVRQRDTSL